MTNETKTEGNEYFMGPIEVEKSGTVGAIGNNLILFERTRGMHQEEHRHLAKSWEGNSFGPEIDLPENRNSYAFKIMGSTLITNPDCYDSINEDNGKPRAWVLEKGKFKEIPYLKYFPVECSIYPYQRTFTKRSPECPLRLEHSTRNFARIFDGNTFGPEFPLILNETKREIGHFNMGHSFVAYTLGNGLRGEEYRQDLVARVIKGNVLGEERLLARDLSGSRDFKTGTNFLVTQHNDNSICELEAWILKDGIFTQTQKLVSHDSYSAGGYNFQAGGNIVAYSPPCEDKTLPHPIHAFILK